MTRHTATHDTTPHHHLPTTPPPHHTTPHRTAPHHTSSSPPSRLPCLSCLLLPLPSLPTTTLPSSTSLLPTHTPTPNPTSTPTSTPMPTPNPSPPTNSNQTNPKKLFVFQTHIMTSMFSSYVLSFVVVTYHMAGAVGCDHVLVLYTQLANQGRCETGQAKLVKFKMQV